MPGKTLLSCITLALSLRAAAPSSLSDLRQSFQTPPADCRIMMRWWWFGPGVTHAELEREMRFMREGGIGGFEVQPVYPLDLDDPARGFRNLPYLSGDFLDALRFTSAKARELGLRMDLTLGSGWPYGGPHVPVTEASSRLRCDRLPVTPGTLSVALPAMETGENLIAIFLAPGEPRKFAAASAREITAIQNGRILIPPSLDGPQVLLVFIASRTGQMVKRAAAGAEGFVVDHYDRRAIDHYLRTTGDRLMQAFDSQPPYAIFSDSLEVYGADWTGDFLEEFRKRRGYDLRPNLPALVGDLGEKTASLRHDWGRTLTELAEERYLTPVREWARRHHTLFRSQTYGTPPVALSSNRLVDLPEGEGSYWNQFTTSRWASSAAHLYDRPVVSSETWTWLHSPAFRATPLDMKAEADRHFLEGINQLVGHGWPYSPESAGDPGWRFYAAAVFNQHNPWWIVMRDVARYLQRVSFLLRQGKPANDVAIYLPTDDAWAHFTLGRVSLNGEMQALLGRALIPRLLESGYGFDFIDDAAIDRLARYRVAILPNVERIPAATARRLEEFTRAGGHLLKTMNPNLAELLQPDVALSPPAPDIGFVHRTLPFAEIYFLANTGNTPKKVQATFRVIGLEPDWWDPLDGTVRPARVLARPKGGVTVALAFEPYGSRVLVFSKRPPAPDAPSRPLQALDLSAGWNVTFTGLKRTISMDQLRSWTEDEDTRYYSGEAVYEKTVTVPAGVRSARLDFGEGQPVPEAGRGGPGMRAWFEAPVREAAVVYVNGQRAGSVWHPPYSIDVTALLHPGENALRVVVGNLAINTLAGHALPDYRLLYSLYGKRFEPQGFENLQPVPAGLLGPIRLFHVKQSAPLQ